MRRAAWLLAATVALDILLGSAFAAAEHVPLGTGLYFATTTATTVGYGDVTPHGWLPHLLAVAVMLTVVPMFAAVFSLVTTALTTAHVRASEDRIKKHVEKRLEDHLGEDGQ